eukprot:gene1634-1783_t
MPELVKTSIGDIRVQSGQSLIQVSGTIVRTGGVRMLEQSKQYQCQNPRCRYLFTVYADPEQDNMLPQPRHCPGMINTKEGVKKCASTSIREVEDAKVCVDYQEIKLQDHVESLSMGRLPRSILLVLQADLVDKFHPGTRCAIRIALLVNHIQHLHGTLEGNQISSFRPDFNIMQMFEKFWSSARANGQEWHARDRIVRAVCPQLCGMFMVKLSLLLALIGGAPTQASGGVKRRCDIHMLMVGDPGCGKSQLLRFAASLLPRSILTTGIGTTGAGLTCSAAKDPVSGDWALEAGAMVLANGGVCCIDEFSSIKEGDKAAIHEAMEQQSVSVAKAGLIVKLPTYTTVIACCNPKGSYDLTTDITTNTAIASPLLSRFDIVLILLDKADKQWDKSVSTFLLAQALKEDCALPAIIAQQQATTLADDPGWSKKTLGQYVMFVKGHFHQITITSEARIILNRYYQQQRQSEARSSARTTVRLLESLLRLAEAHARLMFRDAVLFEDAIIAILCAAQAQSIASLTGQFSEAVKEDLTLDPVALYEIQEKTVLNLLHYSKERLQRDVANMYPVEASTHKPVGSSLNDDPIVNASKVSPDVTAAEEIVIDDAGQAKKVNGQTTLWSHWKGAEETLSLESTRQVVEEEDGNISQKLSPMLSAAYNLPGVEMPLEEDEHSAQIALNGESMNLEPSTLLTTSCGSSVTQDEGPLLTIVDGNTNNSNKRPRLGLWQAASEALSMLGGEGEDDLF